MARVCYYCHGARTMRNGDPCKVCGGTGEHPDFYDKYCPGCGHKFEVCTKWDREPDICPECIARKKAEWATKYCANARCGKQFRYHVSWENVDYCPQCQEMQYKQCPNCPGRIAYKIFWDNIPKYCKECRGFRPKHCANTRCRKEFFYHCEQERVSDYCPQCREWQEKPCPNGDGIIRYKVYWKNIHKYCSNCKGRLTKYCERCGTKISYHCEWPNPPRFCDDCKTIREKECATRGCGNIIVYRTTDPIKPRYCSDCWHKADDEIRWYASQPKTSDVFVRVGIRQRDGKTEYVWGRKGDKDSIDPRTGKTRKRHGHHVEGLDGRTDFHRRPHQLDEDAVIDTGE